MRFLSLSILLFTVVGGCNPSVSQKTVIKILEDQREILKNQKQMIKNQIIIDQRVMRIEKSEAIGLTKPRSNKFLPSESFQKNVLGR